MSDHRTDGARVAEECEAFLAGRYLTALAPDEHAPAWAWLNGIAHGTLPDVASLAADEPAVVSGVIGTAEERWRDVRRRLAQEVVGMAHGDPARLRALQRCLTAVELDLAAHPARAMTPATLLGLALARLEGPAGGCFSL